MNEKALAAWIAQIKEWKRHPTTHYCVLIKEATGCLDEELPIVEQMMRQHFGTLDHVPRAAFIAEAKQSYADIRFILKQEQKNV